MAENLSPPAASSSVSAAPSSPPVTMLALAVIGPCSPSWTARCSSTRKAHASMLSPLRLRRTTKSSHNEIFTRRGFGLAFLFWLARCPRFSVFARSKEEHAKAWTPSVPSPDASLGDRDDAAHHPYPSRSHFPQLAIFLDAEMLAAPHDIVPKERADPERELQQILHRREPKIFCLPRNRAQTRLQCLSGNEPHDQGSTECKQRKFAGTRRRPKQRP